MDQIFLKGIRASGIHGVLPEERVEPQPFEVDISVFGSFAAARSDVLDGTVDYSALGTIAVEVISRQSFNLIETIAEEIADLILDIPGVQEVEVTVRKLSPPVEFALDHAGVRIRRRRG